MLSALDLIAILLALTAAFAWINHRFIGLPHSIGLLVMSVVVSVILVGRRSRGSRTNICSTRSRRCCCRSTSASVLMHGVLGFLLFAGALHVDLEAA